MKKKIKRILIANRGEIARRIIQTCRILNIETVSLHMEEEKEYPHVLEATESVLLEGNSLLETYLNIEKILEVATEKKVDAIHPGYGMLSERSAFANRVQDAGFIFIGPTGDSMDKMGDKIGSKRLAHEFGIPQVPGYYGDNQDEEFLKKEAAKIGLPLLIKASSGGGGKGMRIVEKMEDFSSLLASCKNEAAKSFGSDRVLLERYFTRPRHIEIQLLCANAHKQYYHLFERECSIQRRYQKVVEEAPASLLKKETRENLRAAAVRLAEKISYDGAGTVEFIVDEKENFYFLEMNTRLQVEHPVTEMITGLDLVRLQIEIASGEKIPFRQEEIVERGHSMEIRFYAEDPQCNFLPRTGKIYHVSDDLPPGVRHDVGLSAGLEVSPNFDPMLSKLISYDIDRKSAALRLLSGARCVFFAGVKTNREFLLRILQHKKFLEGDLSTKFIQECEDDLLSVDEEKKKEAFTYQKKKSQLSLNESGNEELKGFRNV